MRYPTLAVIKIAQLAVDRRFGGVGFGRLLVAYVIEYARQASVGIGCRYVTVDARPELEAWYTAQGFVRNKVVNRRKLEHARAVGRDERDLPVSMRYDLLEASDAGDLRRRRLARIRPRIRTSVRISRRPGG